MHIVRASRMRVLCAPRLRHCGSQRAPPTVERALVTGRTVAMATPAPVQQPLERVVIADADNRVVGATTRAEMRARNLIHRASFTFVHNSAGQLFVQRRVAWKETYPSHYDPAPGGVVGEHETYEENAVRELEEEMGVSGCEVSALFDFFYRDSLTSVWGRAFRCVYDGPMNLQACEVASGQWATLAEAAALYPCCPDSAAALAMYMKRLGAGTVSPVGGR